MHLVQPRLDSLELTRITRTDEADDQETPQRQTRDTNQHFHRAIEGHETNSCQGVAAAFSRRRRRDCRRAHQVLSVAGDRVSPSRSYATRLEAVLLNVTPRCVKCTSRTPGRATVASGAAARAALVAQCSPAA